MPRHRRKSTRAKRSSVVAVSAVLGLTSAAGSAFAAPAAQPPNTGQPAGTVAVTAGATELAESVPGRQVDVVAAEVGVTQEQLTDWLAGLAQRRLDGTAPTYGTAAVVSDGTRSEVVVVKPLIADARSGGLAVRDPFSVGHAQSTALLPGSYAGASAAESGSTATAFSILGIATATTASGSGRGAVNCAGVLSVANSSDAGQCVNVLGTFDYRFDAKTGQTSLALTDVTRGMFMPAGTAGRAMLQAIGASGTALPEGALVDNLRVTFGAGGPKWTSDTGVFGLQPAPEPKPGPTAELVQTPAEVEPVIVQQPAAPNPVTQAWENADKQFWDAVDNPQLHEQVTKVTGDWAAGARQAQKDVHNAIEGALPPALRSGNPKSSQPLEGRGAEPAPKQAPDRAPSDTDDKENKDPAAPKSPQDQDQAKKQQWIQQQDSKCKSTFGPNSSFDPAVPNPEMPEGMGACTQPDEPGTAPSGNSGDQPGKPAQPQGPKDDQGVTQEPGAEGPNQQAPQKPKKDKDDPITLAPL
ncbi:hypothetical protein MUG78_17350 [Gordonia alkaliphila]|uniref:hypothetical protein n=1 Tax=Gordonia alkaliphila TaxID=1053547 RepID=UPI001FF1A11A|nr:hypothetical protein [Gordonia alkaliphila]MCK0441168.1 hypothetical protein [Gordonia alkaliphila]